MFGLITVNSIRFNLSCHIELTDVEKELIAKYTAWDYPLTYKQIGYTQVTGLTVRTIVNGKSYEVNDVTTLLNNEEVIKEAYKDIK